MAAVNRNSKDMPVPSFAYTDRYDSRVFIQSLDENGKYRKKTIGYMTDSTPGQERMIPNQYFKETYQNLWSEAYPKEKIPAHEMSIGMYALTLALGMKTGLYGMLRDIYGPEYANSILDYAMFTILHRSGVTQIYEKTMAREVLFSDRLHSDSWYSTFFSEKINEDQHHLLKIRWGKALAEKGLKKVWLSIDGSNNDCVARQSFLAKFGFPKSHNKNKTIVGYMYAVDAETGIPVTYTVYEGSVPDSQAFQKIAVFLKALGIEIEGVILDRGFAVENVFATIEDNNWKYVIMLPTDTYGHTQMVNEHGEEIRWKSQHVLENDAIFAKSDEKKLFGTQARTSNICLFFDGAGGSIQSVRLIRQIQKAKQKAEAAIAAGKRAGIEKKLHKYLKIVGEGAERKVITDYAEWDNAMTSKGFFSIAVSSEITPQKAHDLYKMRDTSETQFCVMKSQEGGDTTRVHKTEGIYSKFALLFISSILRFEIEEACRNKALDTNPMIQGLDSISLIYTAQGEYEAVKNLSTDQKDLFGVFDFGQEDLESLAREYNRRSRKDSQNPDRTFSRRETSYIRTNTHQKGKRASTQKSGNEQGAPIEVALQQKAKSKGGRPKGKKDSKPRKPRSDKGVKRGKRQEN